MTPDVVTALVREGVVDRTPSAKRTLQRVQSAMNAWATECGRDLTYVSRVLAFSAGENSVHAEVEEDGIRLDLDPGG